MILVYPYDDNDTFEAVGWAWSWSGGETDIVVSIPCPYRPGRADVSDTRRPRQECADDRRLKVDECD